MRSSTGFAELGSKKTESCYLSQRENPVVYGGRESRPLRDAPAVGGRLGTQTLRTRRLERRITGSADSRGGRRGSRAAFHPCLRRSASPVDGLRPTRCDRSRHGTARFDRLGESRVEKPRGDDSLADGCTRGGATGRSRSRVETRPADAGRDGPETEPGQPGSPLWKGGPPFTAGEDVTFTFCISTAEEFDETDGISIRGWVALLVRSGRTGINGRYIGVWVEI